MSKKNRKSSKASKIPLKPSKQRKSETISKKRLFSEVPQCSSAHLRQRKHIQLLDPPEEFQVPCCSHGPCLFFTDGRNKKWFSCAIYRSDKCLFRIDVPKDLSLVKFENLTPAIFEYNYEKLSHRLRQLQSTKTSIYWCKKCLDFVNLPHKDPLIGPIEKDNSIFPSKLLPPLENDHGEAQYWFSEESLKVVEDVVKKEEFDSVLCIGAPTVFEQFYNSDKKMNLFMLDFDYRFAQFYSETEFAHYSMLINYFYSSRSQIFFEKFLSQAKNLILICDPPFGAFIKALLKSIDAIKSKFLRNSSNEKIFRTILVLPVFVGKHVLKRDGFKMCDFKITYSNHKQFNNSNKSIVRMFTDISLSSFILSANLGYRYCPKCNRYVCNENEHCELCRFCPSKDGSTYKHCNTCQKCVKSTYLHCKKCSTCHLKNRCL